MTAAILTTVKLLRVLAAVLASAFNVIPLYGIYAWGWEPFQILLLYWAGTVISPAVALTQIAFVPTGRLGTAVVDGRTVAASHRLLIGVFGLTAGVFLAGHLLLLSMLFSAGWIDGVGGAAGALRKFFITSGAWVPLGLAAFGGLIDVLTGAYRSAFVDALARRLHVALARPRPAADPVGGIIGGLFGRIVILQAAIIFGAMASHRFSSVAPLAIMIGLKTLIDLVAARRRSGAKEMGVITRPAAAFAASLLAAGALQQTLMADKVDRLSALPPLAVMVAIVSMVFAAAAWRKVAAERTAVVLLGVMILIGFAAIMIGLADRSPGIAGDLLYGLAQVLIGYFLLPCAVALPIHWLLLRGHGARA